MFRLKSIVLSLGLSALLLNAGCAGVLLAGGAAAGTVAYINGELSVEENFALDRVWQATLDTAKDLQLNVLDQKKDGISARLHAKGADGKEIFINLKGVQKFITQVRIRVGAFGDRDASERILAEIRDRLK